MSKQRTTRTETAIDPKTARGEYRSIYVALVDDPDFQDLSAEARSIFFVLKLKLGLSGIGVFMEETLPRYTGNPSERVSGGLSELVKRDWLRVERNVFWLRNALKFDPSNPLASKNHRTGVINHMAGLPKLAIVNEFARYYDLPEPFEIETKAEPTGKGSERVSEGIEIRRHRTPDDLKETGDKSPEASPHDLHPVEEPDAGPEEADAAPPEQPDPKVVPLRKAELTLNDHRKQAVTLILEKLWQGPRDNPPRRFGRQWSIANELSIWNALVEHDDPEEVNGAIGHMRRIGDFRADEPLSLKLFHSKDPNSRTLYAACLQAYRRELERDAARLQMQMGGIIDQVMARRNVSA